MDPAYTSFYIHTILKLAKYALVIVCKVTYNIFIAGLCFFNIKYIIGALNIYR